VIVSLHWGEERLLIPSPAQVEQAHALVEAGASLILGHHSHVIQGLEVCRGAPIIYSLGNFVVFEVPYTDGDRLTWNRAERTGCILRCDLAANEARNISQVPTYYDGYGIHIDRSGFGNRVVARANRALARGVTPARYRREYFWVKTVLPILSHLRWSRLKRLRLSKVRKALISIASAWRAG
jgi:poly-gamma-glutamate synthesis protein (capsule biosynthesis protein)